MSGCHLEQLFSSLKGPLWFWVRRNGAGGVPVSLWEQGPQVFRSGLGKNVMTKQGEVTLAVCLALVRSHVRGCGQSWTPQCENEVDSVNPDDFRASNILKGLEELSSRRG